MCCSLKFVYKCCGTLNTVYGSEDSLIREEIPWDLNDSDDEAHENAYKGDGDVDDIYSFSDTDE